MSLPAWPSYSDKNTLKALFLEFKLGSNYRKEQCICNSCTDLFVIRVIQKKFIYKSKGSKIKTT